jgi:hypothetical protein
VLRVVNNVITPKRTSNFAAIPPFTTTSDVIFDSGATDTLFRSKDRRKLGKIKPVGGLKIRLPNGALITSKATGELQIAPELAPIVAHIFDDVDLHRSLLAGADVCNLGCAAVLTRDGLTVVHGDKVVLHRDKAPRDPLWAVPLSDVAPADGAAHCTDAVTDGPLGESNNVVSHQHDADYVAFIHAALCSPSVQSLGDALRLGFLGNLPRLTNKMLTNNAPASLATAKGHLNRNRQSQRSKPSADRPPANAPPSVAAQSTDALSAHSPDDRLEAAPEDPELSNTVISKVLELSGQNNSDLTGKLHVTSSRGNCYILVSVFNSYIHLEPMSSREGAQYVAATRRTVEFFRALGHDVTYQRMDNETSRSLENYMAQEKIVIQYVPPQNHRANPAERAIQTAKNHFISAMAGTNPNFPTDQWDELLPQVEITMNLIRPSSADPLISAYEAVHRHKYDFLAHPLAPCGTLVLVHDAPDKRSTFANHGVTGYYLGPALKHYRCFRVHMIATRRERISDSLAWFPAPLVMPGSNPAELVYAALHDLSVAMSAVADNSSLVVPNALGQFRQLTATATEAIRSSAALFLPPPAAESGVLLEDTLRLSVPPAPAAAEQRVVMSQPVMAERVTVASPPAASAQRVVPATAPALHSMATSPTVPPAEEVPVTAIVPRLTPSIAPAAATTVVPTPDGSVRPTRDHSKPARFRSIANVDSNDLSNQEFADLLDNILEDDPHPDELALRDLPMVDLNAICAPLKHSDTKLGPDADLWWEADAEEFDRLFDTATMKPIYARDKPSERLASYLSPQASIKNKLGVLLRRTRNTYGGTQSDYKGPVAANTADLPTIKLFLNAALSQNQRVVCADIKDFYLGTEMERPEYMRILRKQLPKRTMEQRGLEKYMNRGKSKNRNSDWLMVEINKGLYGLPQAGKIAQDKLIKHLSSHGYHNTDNTPCLFNHESRDIAFTLVVDDFCIKYTEDEDLAHLLAALREAYVITVDMEGKKYVGINIEFDRVARTVTLSMPDYVRKALLRFGVKRETRHTDAPLRYTPPSYGSGKQQYTSVDRSKRLSKDEVTRLQEIIGVFLYYARAVDATMLTALSKFSSLQSRATKDLQRAVDRFLQYASWWPDAKVVYHASDMRLMVESDASYLSEPESRSRAGGLFYLGNYAVGSDTARATPNGGVEFLSTIIKSVVTSAFEAEYAALFLNGQTAVGLRHTLFDLGFAQEATPFVSDNACAVGIANRTVKQRRSKAIDMRLHWTRDRVKNGDFTVTWRPGKDNLADYFTKAHPVHHYKEIRSTFVQ